MAASRTKSSDPAARAAPRPEPRTPRQIEGTARLGRRTKRLVKTLVPGDVAIIDHEDIDRVSAEDLVASGVACVVNVAPSSSGRYPNRGPLILAEAASTSSTCPARRSSSASRTATR